MDFARQAPETGTEPVDDVLRAYFRAQLPRPWPAAPRPPRAVARAAWPLRLPSHRLALAASLGLLFVGLVALAGRLTPAVPAPDAVTPTSASPRLVNPRLAAPRGPAPAGRDAYRVLESLHQEGDRPTEIRIEIIPNR